MPQPSYIQYADTSSVVAVAGLQTTDSLFQADVQAGITAGANQSASGCNISFDSFFELDFNIPDAGMFDVSDGFDLSLFDKIDAMSLEVSMINNMLIDSILNMECCDIAGAYNSTLVPFFQFFADTKGDSVMDILITLAEVVTTIKSLVESLECLMPMLPGNPWAVKDVDVFSWINGFWSESGPILDKFFSGEFLDMLLNPIHEMRKQLQACLGGNLSNYFQNATQVGSVSQMEKLASLAARGGNQLTQAQILKPPPIVKPLTTDFAYGEKDQEYLKAIQSYNSSKLLYDKQLLDYNNIVANITKQTEIQKNINSNLAIATQTQALLKVSTDGICGCIADVLGLNDISIIPVSIKTTQDMNNLVGSTVNGVTNKQAGTSSKDRPAEEPLTVKEPDLKNAQAKLAILNSGSTKGKPETVTEKEEIVLKECPYNVVGIPGGSDVIRTDTSVMHYAALIGGPAIVEANDDKEDLQKKMNNLLTSVGVKTDQDRKDFEAVWNQNKVKADRIMSVATEAVGIASTGYSQEAQSIITASTNMTLADLQVARIIYDSMFGTFVPFDLVTDPEEVVSTSLWLNDDILDMIYGSINISSRETDIKDLSVRALAELPQELRNIPFVPNTPPQNIINKLPISTQVDQDTKKLVNYFNAGFVKSGEPLWRNFNLLDLEYTEITVQEGAIQKDKTRSRFAAIFPTDAIGNQAQVNYIRRSYPNTTIDKIIQEELNEPSSSNTDSVVRALSDQYDTSKVQESFSDLELIDIIQAISNRNGFEQGRLWVRTRPVNDDVVFDKYVVSYTDGIFTELEVEGRVITQEEKELINIAYRDVTIQTIDPATQMTELSNKTLEARAPAYAKEVQNHTKATAAVTAIDSLQVSIQNSIASIVNTQVDLLIPCTCDGILCMVLNQVIQVLLSAFQQMVDQIMNTITNFLIPDWVKDIMALMNEYLSCFMAVAGIPAKLEMVHTKAEMLRSDLEGRINYYPVDPCFVPDSIYPDKPIPGEQVSPEHIDYLDGPVALPDPNETWDGEVYEESDAESPVGPQGPILLETVPPYANPYNPLYTGPSDPLYMDTPDPSYTDPSDPSYTGPSDSPYTGSSDGIYIKPRPLPILITSPVDIKPGLVGRSTPGFKFNCDYLQI